MNPTSTAIRIVRTTTPPAAELRLAPKPTRKLTPAQRAKRAREAAIARALESCSDDVRRSDLESWYREGKRGKALIKSAETMARLRRQCNNAVRVLRESERAARKLAPWALEEACRRGLGVSPSGPAGVRVSGSLAVSEILRRVGRAGEQARADEQRYCDEFASYVDPGRKGGICGGDHREISAAWIARDCSAAILAFAEWGSWGVSGARARDGEGRGGLHHLRIQAYLVVRDSTSGERHMIRVPPRFGRTSATKRGMGWRVQDFIPGSSRAPGMTDSEMRIHAAVAWTFGMLPGEYRPQLEA